MLLFDAHLDLSMNALEWNRDITLPLEDVRRRERFQGDKVDRGHGVCTLPEMRRGRMGLCIATQIGRYVSPDNPRPGWHSPEIAWAMTQGQLAWYKAMEDAGQMFQITSQAGLKKMVDLWTGKPPPNAPIGFVLSLEGADSIVKLSYLEKAWAYGLRAIGPAHYGPGRYAAGTHSSGGLTPAGRDLVNEMNRLGIVLDVTHLTDEAFWECMELYDGPLWASHSNCRAIVPEQRQHTDEQIKELIRRDAVMGMAFDAWMMIPGWIRWATMPFDKNLKIEQIAVHIDHIAQIAGSVRHIGIGSDLDGGYGTEQTPMDLQSIADLQKLSGILENRGYSQADIAAIMHGNWIRKLGEVLPA